MEGIFMGQITGSVSSVEDGETRAAQIYFSGVESNACSKLSHYNKTYSLVLSDDVIKTNDELLKLREQVKKLEAELSEIKTTRTLREAYITGVEKGCESLREDRDYWKDRFGSVVTDVSKVLESNGVEFTVKAIDGNKWNVVIDIPELNEAKKKVEDLEKKLAASKSNENYWRDRKEEEEDYHHYWLHTFDCAVKQAAEKGIHIGVCGSDEENNVGIVTVYNMKAEELESQIVALEKTNNNLNQKIGAADNALEYWNNTYNDIVIAGKNVGVKIDIKGKKPDSNAGFVYVTNEKAKELEPQIVQQDKNAEYWFNTFYKAVDQAKELGVDITASGFYKKENVAFVEVKNERAKNLETAFTAIQSKRESLDIQNGSLKEAIDSLKNKIKRLEDDNDTKGDHWKRNYEKLTEYWDNTYKDIVAAGKKVGVKIDLKGRKPDGNTGTVYVTNEKALELMINVSDTKHGYNKKWQAMLNALKDKGVEVIYMGEQYGKPIVDVKIPKLNELQNESNARAHQIDILKKELETLKSRTLDNVEIRLSCGDIVWTYCDGFVHVSSGISGIITADEIATGTVPKCKTCAHYVSGSRSADVWCHKPISKEGPGRVRRLSTEEAEGPACVDFKARKE